MWNASHTRMKCFPLACNRYMLAAFNVQRKNVYNQFSHNNPSIIVIGQKNYKARFFIIMKKEAKHFKK